MPNLSDSASVTDTPYGTDPPIVSLQGFEAGAGGSRRYAWLGRGVGEWGRGRLSELAGVALIDGKHERASLALSIPMGVFLRTRARSTLE